MALNKEYMTLIEIRVCSFCRRPFAFPWTFCPVSKHYLPDHRSCSKMAGLYMNEPAYSMNYSSTCRELLIWCPSADSLSRTRLVKKSA